MNSLDTLLKQKFNGQWVAEEEFEATGFRNPIRIKYGIKGRAATELEGGSGFP